MPFFSGVDVTINVYSSQPVGVSSSKERILIAKYVLESEISCEVCQRLWGKRVLDFVMTITTDHPMVKSTPELSKKTKKTLERLEKRDPQRFRGIVNSCTSEETEIAPGSENWKRFEKPSTNGHARWTNLEDLREDILDTLRKELVQGTDDLESQTSTPETEKKKLKEGIRKLMPNMARRTAVEEMEKALKKLGTGTGTGWTNSTYKCMADQLVGLPSQ
ncbi:hypothetical protein F5Y15DRAFT_372473 [Xylariaceae sp. FL0016]|nr:hypothetical protein F5Y15DRAFT_372473 [Xylariaceae sp. FL0016]